MGTHLEVIVLNRLSLVALRLKTLQTRLESIKPTSVLIQEELTDVGFCILSLDNYVYHFSDTTSTQVQRLISLLRCLDDKYHLDLVILLD